MPKKTFVFSFVLIALVFLSGCSEPKNSAEPKKNEMIDPIEHLEKEVETLDTAKDNINNAVNMQNEKNTQALNESETSNAIAYKAATLHTNQGDITLELYADKMPITVGNFVKLAQEGFYDGIKFHRVMDGFMIQAGDPKTKDESLKAQWGTGGPGYTIEDEFVEGLTNKRGTIAMANTGQENSGGSQWFINLVDNTNLDFDKQPLSSKHPVFGAVSDGMDVVDTIAKTKTEGSNRPIENMIIESISLIEK